MLLAAGRARGAQVLLRMEGGKFVLYQGTGESEGRSRPLCPGAATALRRCPKASPSCREPKLWVEWGTVTSPQLHSAGRGPWPSPACGQRAGQHFGLDLVAACSCQGSGERTWRWRASKRRWSLLWFQVPPAVFQISIKTPVCNSPGSQSIPVCSAWQGWPKHAVKPCRTAFPFLPQKRGVEDFR